ncbi:MAG: hypothetical protein NC181_05105 [Clostridium sp.]|nr:hypothetical protein [Clostridium sp.]MCM1444631.1 hypothetical protein [Candidatus Amulumruptor caecigallinarius]
MKLKQKIINIKRLFKYSFFHFYKNIKETIWINLNTSIKNKQEIKDVYYLTNKYGEILDKKLRIDMVDVAKASEIWYPNIENKLVRWSKVLVAKTEYK